jgi:threonine 3-dehydrogenase
MPIICTATSSQLKIWSKPSRAVFPEFTCGFTPGSPTDDLILRWPDVFDDRAARADWGWEPHYDFDATVEALVQFAKSQS